MHVHEQRNRDHLYKLFDNQEVLDSIFTVHFQLGFISFERKREMKDLGSILKRFNSENGVLIRRNT